MEAGNENDRLKKLLRESRIEEDAPAGFTGEIIRQIQAASAANAGDTALKSLLQQHAFEIPSAQFQQNIIAQLAVSRPVIAPEPLIQRITWYWIAATFTLLAIIGFAFQANGKMDNAMLLEVIGRISSWIYLPKMAVGITEIALPALSGFAALLVIDFVLRPAPKKTSQTVGSGWRIFHG